MLVTFTLPLAGLVPAVNVIVSPSGSVAVAVPFNAPLVALGAPSV